MVPVKTKGGSRAGSAPSSRHSSPPRSESQLDLSSLQTTLNQLTAAVSMVAENQVRQQAAQVLPQSLPISPMGPSGDPEFDWGKLFQPPKLCFPPASVGQVQLLAEDLLANIHRVNRNRDLHEIRFCLQMASQYPRLSPEAQNALYQQLNFFYIVVKHGWPAALSAATSVTASAAVFPPGFKMLPSTYNRPRQQYKNCN